MKDIDKGVVLLAAFLCQISIGGYGDDKECLMYSSGTKKTNKSFVLIR